MGHQALPLDRSCGLPGLGRLLTYVVVRSLTAPLPNSVGRSHRSRLGSWGTGPYLGCDVRRAGA